MSSATQPIGVIARLLDLSERRVQQLSREGVIPKAERGQYDLIGSVRGYVRYLRDQALKAQAGAPDYAPVHPEHPPHGRARLRAAGSTGTHP